MQYAVYRAALSTLDADGGGNWHHLSGAGLHNSPMNVMHWFDADTGLEARADTL